MNPFESQPRSQDFQKAIEKRKLFEISDKVIPGHQGEPKFTELKSGRFNTTYVAQVEQGESVILRIAPHATSEVYFHEQYLLRREYAVSSSLSSVVEHAPQFLYVDFTGQVIDRDFAALSFIEGQNWAEVMDQLSSEDNLDLWHQLSSTAVRINQAVGDGFGFPNPMSRSDRWSIALANIQRNMVLDLEKYSLDSYLPKELLGMIEERESILDQIDTPRLVHGDLWPKNILIKDTNAFQIAGVLDSERAFWGDPRAEWIMLGSEFAEDSAGDGSVFRCGLFSADYAEIPSLLSEKYLPKSFQEFIQSQVYLGIYLTQRRLESQRFHRDEKWIDEELKKVMRSLKGS